MASKVEKHLKNEKQERARLRKERKRKAVETACRALHDHSRDVRRAGFGHGMMAYWQNVATNARLRFNTEKDPVQCGNQFTKLCKVVLHKHKMIEQLAPNVRIEAALESIVLHHEFWVADPEKWKPKSHNYRRKFGSLISYLFCKYNTPLFLETVFFINWGTQSKLWTGLFPYLAQGGSVKKFIDEHSCFKLTAKAAHIFMQTKAEYNLIQALRRAQALASGCNEAVAHEVCDSSIATAEYFLRLNAKEEEEFIITVFQWFANQQMLDPNQVRNMIDYIIHMYRRDTTYSMRGRTVNRLLEDMRFWHNPGNHTSYADSYKNIPEELPTCYGFPLSLKLVEGGKQVEYCIEEIKTKTELRFEGVEMRHCVFSYIHSISSGQTSIWSLRRNKEKMLTIELRNSTRSIVQVKGSCNRSPTQKESGLVGQWAANNRYNYNR